MAKKSINQTEQTGKNEASADVAAVEKEMDEILLRARQTVKPIVKREAANEIVTEDVLNFRMKVRE